MAKPRVFVSSTYYDLKHVRASLDVFIRSLGYESVLSEKGDIAYSFDRPLDESCYAEVNNCDLFVMIIGGRYGSAASSQPRVESAAPEILTFTDRYRSITRGEYERAAKNDIPIYILIDRMVDAEYRTYQLNKTNPSLQFAHVESANVFELIEEIRDMPRNNPMQQFDRYEEIELWLREQWAGTFRDMLSRKSQVGQLSTMSEQIAELREVNETLRNYLETLVAQAVPDQSDSLISNEARRIESQKSMRQAWQNPAFQHLLKGTRLSERALTEVLRTASSTTSLLDLLMNVADSRNYARLADTLSVFTSPIFISDLNEVLRELGSQTVLKPATEARRNRITKKIHELRDDERGTPTPNE